MFSWWSYAEVESFGLALGEGQTFGANQALSQLSFPLTNQLHFLGGAMRDRTADLLDANQALSQLSYSPIRK